MFNLFLKLKIILFYLYSFSFQNLKENKFNFDYFNKLKLNVKNTLLSQTFHKNYLEKKLPIYEKKIRELNYSFEEHKILTKDGYILTAWRIPSKLNETYNENRPPIILQHGLIDSSYTWLILDKDYALPYLLVDNGYDVWLTNTRGNAVCNEHSNVNEYDSNDIHGKYWDFSFHEMAIYDLPANINYIKKITGYKKIDYISHSQGGLIYFILYTIDNKFIENNINHFFSLGTVITTFTSKSLLLKYSNLPVIKNLFNYIPIKNIMVFNDIYYKIIEHFCSYFNKYCYYIVNFIISNNNDTQKINVKKLFKEFLYAPAGTSAKNLKHWNQIYTNKRLAMFDYENKEKNFKIYGKEKPPEYDLSKFVNYKIKSILYISNCDPFSNSEDLNVLIKYMNKKYVKIRKMKDYNHLDFLWSEYAKDDIYSEIINVLNKDYHI